MPAAAGGQTVPPRDRARNGESVRVGWWRRHAALAATCGLMLADALLTLPFLFPVPADPDTVLYLLGVHRWSEGLAPFASVFNAEMSPAFYVLARGLAEVTGTGLPGLARLLHVLSWVGGVAATGFLFTWWRRWLGLRTALALTALFLTTPAFWALHLYGSPNLTGLALAAAAAAVYPYGAFGGARWDGTRFSVRVPGLRSFLPAGALALIALTARADVLQLLPVLLVAAGQTGGRRSAVRMLALWLTAFAAYLLVRAAVIGVAEAGSVGRHLSRNLGYGSAHWLGFNLYSLATAAPPLVLGASALAFLRPRGTGTGRMRVAVAAWLLGGAIFLPFARIHIVRILIPLVPALLLPLAAWGARGGRRRVAGMAGLILAGHLLMFAQPVVLDRVGLRAQDPPRPTHWHFVGNVVADHAEIARQAARRLELARAAVERVAEAPDLPLVVLSPESTLDFYAFQEAWPRAGFADVAREGKLVLREARAEEGGRLGYLMEQEGFGPVEPALRALGLEGPVRVFRTDPRDPAAGRLVLAGGRPAPVVSR